MRILEIKYEIIYEIPEGYIKGSREVLPFP